MAEKTLFQLVGAATTELIAPLLARPDSYRKMRLDPTIALARELSMAAIVGAKWSYESDDDVYDERLKFIQKQCDEWRYDYVSAAMMGDIDFGWAPFEIVYDIIENKSLQIGGAKIGLVKVKPLLWDITKILIDEKTGAFIGFKQGEIVIPIENSLLCSFRAEGTQWYGRPLLENCRETYNQFRDANTSASRYDRKMSGSSFVIYYPYGTTSVEGEKIDNFEIAKKLLVALENANGICIPSAVSTFVDMMNEQNPNSMEPQWKVDTIDGGMPKQYSFTNRLEYLDKLKVRGLIFPERALTEGKFGTKADAGEHGDLATLYMDIKHYYITKQFNNGPVRWLMELNFGSETVGTIRVRNSPLVNSEKSFMQTLYQAIVSSAQGAEEFGTIDTDAMKDELGIPKRTQVALMDNDPGMNPDDITKKKESENVNEEIDGNDG